MLKRRRAVAPSLRVPPPFNPLTGHQAPIGNIPTQTRLALFQVIEEDTRDNYLVCRGFDPENNKFYHELAVAKAWSERGKFNHTVGQVFPAAKFKTRLGDNSGMSKVSVGQPEDLDEEIVFVKDDAGRIILWTEIAGGGAMAVVFELKTSIDPDNPSGEAWPRYWDDDAQDYVTDYEAETIWVGDSPAKRRSLGCDDMPEDKPGAYGWAFTGAEETLRIGSIQEVAKRLRAKAKGKINGETTGAVDDVAALDGGQLPKLSGAGGDELTVNNPLRHYYADNTEVELEEDKEGGYNLLAMKQITFRGTLSGPLAYNSSATANLTGIGSETVYDHLMKSGASTIASGKKIKATWYSDVQKFYVDEAECP